MQSVKEKKLSPERIREVVNSGRVGNEKKTWVDIFKQLMGKTWNEGKRQKLREFWRSCSDFYGYPKFSDVGKLRRLAALINQYCDSKASIPSELADVVKLIETEGLIDTSEFLFDKPIYLGFVASPSKSDIFGGYFVFKCKVVAIYRRGFYFDENGERRREYQKKEGWGFFNLYLTGKSNIPYPHYKSESELMGIWKQIKRDNKVIEGNPKNIRIT